MRIPTLPKSFYATLFLWCSIFVITGCEKEMVCLEQDWTGTYTGNRSCNSFLPPEVIVTPVVITVEPGDFSGLNVRINQENGNLLRNYTNMIVDNCSLQDNILVGIGSNRVEDYTATLDGNVVRLREDWAIANFRSLCETTATRN